MNQAGVRPFMCIQADGFQLQRFSGLERFIKLAFHSGIADAGARIDCNQGDGLSRKPIACTDDFHHQALA